MAKIKTPRLKENKTKVITIRIAPSIHLALSRKAKSKKKSLSKYITEAAIQAQ